MSRRATALNATVVYYYRRAIGRLLRLMASNAITLPALNRFYTLFNDRKKSSFHSHYAKIFRERGVIANGEWTVVFDGKKLRLPLRAMWSWLDWDTAVSIIGHDIEIKQTYAALVKSKQRPGLFLDIGANYGTHSVLFLSAGIPTIAFEPNPDCFAHFQKICELNGLIGRWEQVALGNSVGQINLIYPPKDTWLDSVSSANTPKTEEDAIVTTTEAPLKRLDDYYLDVISYDKILIKIDVEGFDK